MNEIINKFLLAGDKFMPELHLRQPGFTYSACGPFTKNKERIEKFMKTGNTDFIYKNELDKACFQHDVAYGKSKDLVKRTQSDKVLRDKAFKIASDPIYDGYQRGLASMVYKFFDKKSKGSGITNGSNYQLANELHKPIIKKFKKRKVYSSFRDNIWDVDLADMQSLSRYNKSVGTSKDFLKTNNIEIYSTFNEGKSVVAERFIRTLKNKIFKHMTAISKNVYFDVLDDIVNKYNNKNNEYNEEFNKKDPKFKVGDHVRISNYKNVFAKGYVPNWSEEVFIVNKIKSTVTWTYSISDLNGEEIIGSFYEKELQKTNQK